MPEGEWTTKLCAAEAVCGHLKAVLEECHAPAYEYHYEHALEQEGLVGRREAFELILKGDMSVPRQRHKDVRADEKRDG